MTYCVGLFLKEGAVLLSDTRTNAGPDNIAAYSKMHVVAGPDRVIALMTSGNLAVTQAVIARATEMGAAEDGAPALQTLSTVHTMYDAARVVGDAVREVYHQDGQSLAAQALGFDISIILIGQISDQPLRMFQIYSAGNFIEATADTPYFQIGETKYGKPILDRVANYDIALEDAVKLALISMDSTLRSNFSVGLPADLLVYRRDSLKIAVRYRVTEHDPYFRNIREAWSEALRNAYQALPMPPYMGG